jgi:predicted flap endonuclease-1-like 5' DNA nuclease
LIQGEIEMRKPANRSVPLKKADELSIAKLSQISGIARKTAQALNEIGIYSYADLIEYLNQHTVEEFSARLNEHGVNRRPGLIDRDLWIRQAELLSEVERGLEVPSSEAEGPKSRSEPELGERTAVFTVSFDIAADESGSSVTSVTVYDESNGGAEATFKGGGTEPWVSWILQRTRSTFSTLTPLVKTEDSQEPGSDRAGEAPLLPALEPGSFQIEIDSVRVSVLRPKLSLPERRLKAQLRITLTGDRAEQLTLQDAALRTEMYTISLDNGLPDRFGMAEDRLKPHVLAYTCEIEAPIPAVGRYELHSVVRLLPAGELSAYHRGPILRVAP